MAVIGGGKSGVEAAIDLAGVVANVTLIEFLDQLKADAVLVNKLKSLPNVTIHVNAQTTEITGDGSKVNGLRYKDRVTGQEQLVPLEGVFVQIGLVPNTEFLKGSLELSKFGEIVIDAKCHPRILLLVAQGKIKMKKNGFSERYKYPKDKRLLGSGGTLALPNATGCLLQPS